MRAGIVRGASWRAPGRGRARGVTLLELMLVLAILGLVFGVGLGTLSSLDLGQRSAVGLVQNVVRAARDAAVVRGAPARVRIDPAGGTLAAEAMDVIGTWHFEAVPLSGAFGLDGELLAGELVDDGWIGHALAAPPSNGGRRGALARFPVQGDASWDLSQGFAVDCALRPGETGGVVLDLGGAGGLELDGRGGLRAWIVPSVAREGEEPRAGGPLDALSPPGAVVPGRWQRVGVRYDRRALRILVEGVPVAVEPHDAPVWGLEGALAIGAERGGFDGALDALVVAAVAVDETVALPRDVRFAPDAPREVVFDADGRLDRAAHDGPVAIEVVFSDGRRGGLRVGLYGTVE